jgi:hypothetical protein
MERPEYFVVRLYRRDAEDPARIEGVVEQVATGKQFAFADAGQLWSILRESAPAPDRPQP